MASWIVHIKVVTFVGDQARVATDIARNGEYIFSRTETVPRDGRTASEIQAQARAELKTCLQELLAELEDGA